MILPENKCLVIITLWDVVAENAAVESVVFVAFLGHDDRRRELRVLKTV